MSGTTANQKNDWFGTFAPASPSLFTAGNPNINQTP